MVQNFTKLYYFLGKMTSQGSFSQIFVNLLFSHNHFGKVLFFKLILLDENKKAIFPYFSPKNFSPQISIKIQQAEQKLKTSYGILPSNCFACSINSLKKWTEHRTLSGDCFWINKKAFSQWSHRLAKLGPIWKYKFVLSIF